LAQGCAKAGPCPLRYDRLWAAGASGAHRRAVAAAAAMKSSSRSWTTAATRNHKAEQPKPSRAAANADPEVCADGNGVVSESIKPMVSRVRAAATAIGLTGRIIPFGSHVNGFSTASSDCDLSYMPQAGATEKPVWVLQHFAQELPRHGFKDIVAVFQASIPLIKAIDQSGLEVDICVGNHLGRHNSRLVAAYCKLEPRVGEVGRLVKQWAKSWDLIGNSDGHMNSYAYTLLTIFYLMHVRPPVVPNLQELSQDLPQDLCDSVKVRDRRWGREEICDCTFWSDVHLIPKGHNTDSVGPLLRGFFAFYTDPAQFDWGSHAVSIRMANTQETAHRTSKFGLHSSVSNEQWYVEDPFDLRHNLASQCTREGRQRILGRMAETLRGLADAGEDALGHFASHCSRGLEITRAKGFILKCHVHTEKVKLEDFTAALASARCGPFQVQFPPARVREVMDAFLIFPTETDRRRVHSLNESYVGEWQLRLLPCSGWALDDALAAGGYKEVTVTPRGAPLEDSGMGKLSGDEASEKVRSGLRFATSKGEVNVLIQQAQALGLAHEEQMGRSRLQKLTEQAEQVTEEPAQEVRFQ